MMSSIKKTIGKYSWYKEDDNNIEVLEEEIPFTEPYYPPFVESRKSSHHRPSLNLEGAKETRGNYQQEQYQKVYKKMNPIIQITQYITNAKYNPNDAKSNISMLSANNSAFKMINETQSPINRDHKKIINYNDFHIDQRNKPVLLLNYKRTRDDQDNTNRKMSLTLSEGSHYNKINRSLIEHIALNQSMKRSQFQSNNKTLEDIRLEIERKNRINEEAIEEMQRNVNNKKQKTEHDDKRKGIQISNTRNKRKPAPTNMFDYLYENEEEETTQYPRLSLGYGQGIMYKGKPKEFNLTISSSQSFEYERIEKKMVQIVPTNINNTSHKKEEPVFNLLGNNDPIKKPTLSVEKEEKKEMFPQKQNSLFNFREVVDNKNNDMFLCGDSNKHNEETMPKISLFTSNDDKPELATKSEKKEEKSLFGNLGNISNSNSMFSLAVKEPSKDNNLFNYTTENDNEKKEKMKQFLKEEPIKLAKVEEPSKDVISTKESSQNDNKSIIENNKTMSSFFDVEVKKEIKPITLVAPVTPILPGPVAQNEHKLPEKPTISIKPKEDKDKSAVVPTTIPTTVPTAIPTTIQATSTIPKDLSMTLVSQNNPFIKPLQSNIPSYFTNNTQPSQLFQNNPAISLFPQNTTVSTSNDNIPINPHNNTSEDQMEISPYTSPKAKPQSIPSGNTHYGMISDTSVSQFNAFPSSHSNIFTQNNNNFISLNTQNPSTSLFDNSRPILGNTFNNIQVPQSNAFSSVQSNIGVPQATFGGMTSLGSMNTTFSIGKKKN